MTGICHNIGSSLMKTHLPRQLLMSSAWKISHILFLAWFPLVQAATASQNFVVASPTSETLEKESYRITTRLTAQSPLAVNSEIDTGVVEITATPEKVEVISTSNPLLLRKKEKKTDHPEGLPGLAGFPLSPERPSFDSYGGGYLGQDDDDSFKQPPYFPAREKGDFTLTLLPVLRIPSDWRSYLPGNQWYHWVIGEPDHDSGVTLHISFNGSSPSVMQLSQAEYRQFKEHLGNSQQLLQWLAPKLSGREAFIHTLLDIASGLSEQDDSTRLQIEKQIDTLAEWSDHELSLEFEWEQLGRSLAADTFKELSEDRGPDTELIYEGEEVNKLIHKAMFSWLWSSTKPGATGSGSGTGQGGSKRLGRTGGAQDDDVNETLLLARMKELSLQGPPPSVRIVFAGMQDVGKSSLGNRLIGWEPFKETKVFNRLPDPVYRFRDVEIRALKGYGDFDYATDYIRTEYIADQDIKVSDIVIFLFDSDLNGYDREAIQVLKAHGNEMIFVCNKIDRCADNDREREKQKKEIKDRFEENLTKLGFTKIPNLIFTCSDLSKLDEITATKELEEEIIYALDRGQREVFAKFLKTRFRADEKLIKLVKDKVEDMVRGYETQLPSIDTFNSITSKVVVDYIKPEVLPGGTIDYELGEFKKDFHRIAERLTDIVPDGDSEFFLRTCNRICQEGYSEGKVGAGGALGGAAVGGAIGTTIGPWGTVAGAFIGGLFGGLVGVGSARGANYLFKPNLNIELASYYRCREEVERILTRDMEKEIAGVDPQQVTYTVGGVSYTEENSKIKKIKQRYQDKINKFTEWVENLQKIMASSTHLLREVIENQLTYYQKEYDQTFFLKTSVVVFPALYDEIPDLETVPGPEQNQPLPVSVPLLPPTKPPHILQNYHRAMTARDEKAKALLSSISFTGKEKEVAQCSRWMKKNFPDIRTRLKRLWSYQSGQQASDVKTAILHENGYYNSVIFIPLLYAYGVKLDKIKQCNSDERIINLLTEYGFSPFREAITQQKVPDAIKDERLLNAIELAVLIRDSPERTPIFLEGVSSLEIPELIFQLLAKPMDRPRQYSELMKVTATLLHKPEQIQIDQPLLEAMTVGKNAELLHDIHNIESQPVQITQPAHGVSAALLRLAANTADWVFSMGKWMDKVTYESLPAEDPKRTRIHRIGFLAEPLYGIHLKTLNLFNEYIGDMTEPVIVAVNGYGDTNVWHAFLLFRNSKDGEFNTLHIRQGSYYPEFMDKEATLTYLREQKKILKDAFSVSALSVLYGSEPDLSSLRKIYSELCSELWIYKMKDNNCMTFSMLALDATPLKREDLLARASAQGVHSPYHIMKAIRESREKDHSSVMYNPTTNDIGLPDWLLNPRL